MRLRRFEASTVSNALALVRRDLGPDAVILHARALPPPAGGAGGGGRVEVMAAVDESAGAAAGPAARAVAAFGARRYAAQGTSATAPAGGRRPAPAEASRPSGGTAIGPGVPPAAPVPEEVAPDGDGMPEALPHVVEDIRRLLDELRAERGRPAGVPAPLRAAHRHLLAHDVAPAVARRLLEALPPAAQAGRRGLPTDVLREAAARGFRVSGPIAPGRGQRRVALVGPTGVGKTTTIAKLAGQLGLAGDVRVALMTLDTYRIGAVAQLQIYADLLGVSLHVVRTPEEARGALEAARDADLVLVDTMGRSPRGAEGIAAIGRVLRAIPELEVHLVVSATTKGADLEEVLWRFRPLRYRRLLATKLDEVRTVGPLLSLALERGLTLSYLSAGQEVPDDLEPATPWRLAGLLIPDSPGARRRAPVRA